MLVLADRERVRLGAEREVRAIEAQANAERLDWRGRLEHAGSVDVGGVRMQAGAALRGLAGLRRAVLTLAAAERAVAGARAALLEAARRRRAIEELKERRWNEWRAERLRLEQRSLDELVVMGHGRRDSDEQGDD